MTIGNISSLTNAGATFNGFEAGVTAYFDYSNAHGGINGTKVNLISLDDGADPGKSATDAHTLVQQDKVLAIVGEASLADAATQKYLQASGVPVIGGWATSSAWQSPATNMFVSLEGPNAPYCPLWSSPLAKAVGVKKIAFIAQDFPSAISDAKCRQAAAQRVGLQVASQVISVSPTAVDYRPEIQQAMASGADAIYFSAGGSGIVQGIQAGQELGFKGYYIATQPSGLLKSLAPLASQISGRLLTSSFALLPDASAPSGSEMAKYQAGIKQYEPQYASDVTSVNGWAAGVEFADALKAAGPKAPAMIKWLSGQKAFTFGGLQGPMNWTTGSHANPCTLPLIYKNGAWSVGPIGSDATASSGGFSCGVLFDPSTGKVNG